MMKILDFALCCVLIYAMFEMNPFKHTLKYLLTNFENVI